MSREWETDSPMTGLPTAARAEDARPKGGRRTILIVDDEADMVESCARICRRGGFTCVTAVESRDALALFERMRPDLLCTDLRMPGFDGLELVRQVKLIDSSVPVLVLTGYVSEASAREALLAGASAYLAKPFTVRQFCETVNRALGLECDWLPF